jgi:lycopene cyclase domain-containing protein
VGDAYQYVVLMAACLLITVPLEVFLGARVWRRPGRLLRVLLPVVAVFFVWDVAAIARHEWHFDPRYLVGWTLVGQVPVEELLFFVTIPICGLLTLGAVRHLLGDTNA